jgi:hypothetical protein
MPRVIVNICSMVTGRVIQSLSTLELTIERHFCSNLEHHLRHARDLNAALSLGSEYVQSGKYRG